MSDRREAQSGHAHQPCVVRPVFGAQYAIDAGDGVFAAGSERPNQTRRMRCRRDNLAQTMLAAYGRDVEGRLGRLRTSAPTTPADGKLTRAIAKCRDEVFVFVTRRDVPATNGSKRALRSSVIFRKVTDGFRSA